MDYEKGKALLEPILMEPCPSCDGTGRQTIAGDPEGRSNRCPRQDCDCGKVVNGLGDALVEFLHDHLTHFAEKDHGHYLRGED